MLAAGQAGSGPAADLGLLRCPSCAPHMAKRSGHFRLCYTALTSSLFFATVSYFRRVLRKVRGSVIAFLENHDLFHAFQSTRRSRGVQSQGRAQCLGNMGKSRQELTA